MLTFKVKKKKKTKKKKERKKEGKKNRELLLSWREEKEFFQRNISEHTSLSSFFIDEIYYEQKLRENI